MSARPRPEPSSLPPRAESPDDGSDDFTLRNAGEIASLIERMCRERTLTTVEIGDGHATVSSILEVRHRAGVLIFDIAHDVGQNRRLFAASRLSFVTSLDQIEIAFDTGPATLVTLRDGPAAVVELPETMVRLQRREWFRVTIPGHENLRCTVLDRDGNASPARAVDLSCGGAGLVFEELGPCLGEPGSEHSLIFSLPDEGRIDLDATLSNVMAEPSPRFDEPPRMRAGFRFVSVAPRTESRIQRYVNRVEVSRRKD